MSVATAPAPTRVERAQLKSKGIRGQIDRENGIIRGVVLAELGPFQTPGRGQFTQDSFDRLLQLGRDLPGKGLKSRFTHPNMSNDGLGKFLARVPGSSFKQRANKLLGDYHFDSTALKPPPGGGPPLGHYVMDLAESDPEAFETSFVLTADQVVIMDDEGNPKLDENGRRIPPIWLPVELHASDVVDDGDAVRGGFLSARNTSEWAREATNFIEEHFGKLSRDELSAKLQEFSNKLLTNKFGEVPMPTGEAQQQPAQLSNDQLKELIGGMIKESLAPVTEMTAMLKKQADIQAEAQRVKTITALCAQAQLPTERATELIGKTELSIEQIRAQLWEEHFSGKRPMPKMPPSQQPGGEGGSDGTAKTEKELSAIWDNENEVLSQMGITEEQFKKDEAVKASYKRADHGLSLHVSPDETQVVKVA